MTGDIQKTRDIKQKMARTSFTRMSLSEEKLSEREKNALETRRRRKERKDLMVRGLLPDQPIKPRSPRSRAAVSLHHVNIPELGDEP